MNKTLIKMYVEKALVHKLDQFRHRYCRASLILAEQYYLTAHDADPSKNVLFMLLQYKQQVQLYDQFDD